MDTIQTTTVFDNGFKCGVQPYCGQSNCKIRISLFSLSFMPMLACLNRYSANNKIKTCRISTTTPGYQSLVRSLSVLLSFVPTTQSLSQNANGRGKCIWSFIYMNHHTLQRNIQDPRGISRNQPSDNVHSPLLTFLIVAGDRATWCSPRPTEIGVLGTR